MVKLQVTLAVMAICLTMVLSKPSDSDNQSDSFGNRRPSSTTKATTPSPSSSSPSSSSPISSSSSPSSSSPSPSSLSISSPSTSSPSSYNPSSSPPKPSDDYSYYDEICPDYDLMEYDEDMSSGKLPTSTEL
ncbi:unnamed protein product [Diamesa tonsa]